MSTPEQSPPLDLGRHGRELWERVTEGLTFRPDELEVLAQAARTADQLAALDALVAASPTVVKGSKGQSVLHPAIAEARLQRHLLATLLARLDVPEGEETEWDGLSTSERGRKAARARWAARTRRAS